MDGDGVGEGWLCEAAFAAEGGESFSEVHGEHREVGVFHVRGSPSESMIHMRRYAMYSVHMILLDRFWG